jgi:hypothetical protein
MTASSISFFTFALKTLKLSYLTLSFSFSVLFSSLIASSVLIFDFVWLQEINSRAGSLFPILIGFIYYLGE